MFREKGVCTIWKNVSYIAATILPVLAEGDRIRHLPSALFMFFLQCGKEPGSFRFLFLHGDRQRRSFGAEFPDLYRPGIKRRDPRIGHPDYFRRHRVVRNLHLAADQGRFRLIFPALEAYTCPLVYQPGFVVEKCLRHDDIPCLVTGREDFLDDPAVRGALGFLRSLVVPADNAALESALRLLWNCPADLIQKAQTLCQKMGTLDSAALQEAVRGHGILENWLGRAEVWLPLVRTETPRKLVEQWEEQYGTSPALERLRNTAVFHEDFDSLWDALVLGQEADLRRASGKHWASGAVRLMTLHGAKGLEFPAVFLAGLSAGAMPLKSPGRPADVEEERRLFFVGLTRAREELILTAAPEFSPFLRELPETVVRETTGRRREAEQLRLF